MNRVSVVTGTTSGIGRVVARELARDGHTVVMVCRNAAKAERTRDLIRRETSNDRVEIVLADLSSLADVRRAGEEVLARWPRLDLLVNNAGVISTDRTTTVDGFETTFAVNHLVYVAVARARADAAPLRHDQPAGGRAHTPPRGVAQIRHHRRRHA